MKKTLTINLGGLIFHIDEDAFNKLELYLRTLRNQFAQTSGGDEIISDVETRMAELFRERNNDTKEVINTDDVDKVISILGKPEDYLQDEDYAQANTAFTTENSYSKKLHRDVDNRMIAGVASGLAAYMNISSIWIRLLFVALFFSGFGFFLYIILWIVVPGARTTAEKLQMRGKPVTLSNIENFVKEEAQAVGQSMKNLGQKANNYRSQPNTFAAVIGQFFQGIIEIIKLIFKGILKLLGFLLLIWAFLLLGFLAIAFFIGLDINNSHYTISELSNLLDLITTDNTLYSTINLGLSLVIIGPLFLVVYYGIRLVFGVEPLNRGVRRGLAFLSLGGIIVLANSAYQVAELFDDSAYYRNEEKLDLKSRSYRLEVVQDDIYYDFESDYNHDLWTLNQGKSFFNDLKIDIKKSSKDYSYIEREVKSYGRDRQDARENTQNVEYTLLLDSALIKASNYYSIKKGTFYRGQRVRLNLYMAVGDTIFLSPGTESLFYDLKNINDYWDNDMVGHFWTMTNKGLMCADCTDSDNIYDSWEDEEENNLEDNIDSAEPEVIIEDGLIIIRDSQVYQENPSQEIYNMNQKLALMYLPLDSYSLI